MIPDPGFQAYRGGVILAGGEPHLVPLRPENDFLIPLDEIPDDVRSRLRLLYLNYPNNPTAATAPREYLSEAVGFCRDHNALLVYDHAYSELAFNGYRSPSILEIEGADGVALEFHSLSKTYNMTGWRLGWVAGNADLIEGLSKVKTFMDTGVFKAVQAAGAAALAVYDDWAPENVALFQARRDVAVEAFGHYLRTRSRDQDPGELLLNFLDWEDPDEEAFGPDVRIILVSADFGKFGSFGHTTFFSVEPSF